MKISFRVDAGANIGLGHFMRCRSLAREYVSKGFLCDFFIKGDYLPNNETGIKFHKIDDFSNLLDEANRLNVLANDASFLILDSYLLSSEYIDSLNKKNRILVCIDDTALYDYSCDYVVNGNLCAESLAFKAGKKIPKYLLGGNYTMLREEFQNASPIDAKKNANSVFICFGGSDAKGATALAAKALAENSDINLNIVLGEAAKSETEISELIDKRKNATLYVNPSNLVDIIRSSDIGIVSNSTISYEVASLGLPFISVTLADNQKMLGEHYAENNLSVNLGEIENVSAATIRGNVVSLLRNYEKRRAMSEELRAAINRNGARNVAETIK